MTTKPETDISLSRPGVYGIKHAASLRLYIGQSGNVGRRLNIHRRKLQSGTHENPELQRYWNQYGSDAFTFFVLEFAPVGLGGLALQRWLWHRETKHWKDGGLNVFNVHPPEMVETPEAIKEYHHEKKVQTKEISKKINAVNELLARVKDLERPPYSPIADLSAEIRELDNVIWKATGWRQFFFIRHLTIDSEQLGNQRKEKAARLASLRAKYEVKDKLRSELLAVRARLYNSYPGNLEKRAKRYELPFRVYGKSIKRVNKTIFY